MKSSGFLKRILITLAVIMAANDALAADVGVSVSIGQPGFYGRIDIGDYPYPQPYLINPRPIIIQQSRAEYEPIYLHVPPGHAKHWRNYCGRYQACDRPVYFVQDRWYNDDYAPRYREQHGYGDGYRDRGYGRDQGENRGRGSDGWDRGDNRGHGEDRGRGGDRGDNGGGHDRGRGRD